MTWANGHYAPGRKAAPSRLIVEVANPADEDIVQYLQAHAYEVEGDNLDAGRATWFLQILTGIVLAIGILITLLSLYVLLLSICLLLAEEHAEDAKSPADRLFTLRARVALPGFGRGPPPAGPRCLPWGCPSSRKLL